ncbi:hypothetical protein CRUP_011768, partial [Coryphaenoides rupestris]
QQQQVQMLTSRAQELQAALDEAQERLSDARQEAELLRREAELQAQRSVSLDDHTRVVSSLGNAIKELEGQSEGLREELTQKKTQVDALQNRLTTEKLTPDDSASRLHQQATRQGLEGEVSRLTQLLQGALRKQDELALETAAAWQEVRESRVEREALQGLLASRETESRAELLRREAELQAQRSVSLDDHTRVVSSLGNAIKELEGQSEGLREELTQKKTQVDALQNRLTTEKLTPDDSASRLHQQATRQGLEGEVSRLTQLLQGALRKQDELALETAAAWQE